MFKTSPFNIKEIGSVLKSGNTVTSPLWKIKNGFVNIPIEGGGGTRISNRMICISSSRGWSLNSKCRKGNSLGVYIQDLRTG